MTEIADTQSYVEAFYEIAGLMGIGAQAASPKEVYETQMRPKLKAALEALAKQEGSMTPPRPTPIGVVSSLFVGGGE